MGQSPVEIERKRQDELKNTTSKMSYVVVNKKRKKRKERYRKRISNERWYITPIGI